MLIHSFFHYPGSHWRLILSHTLLGICKTLSKRQFLTLWTFHTGVEDTHHCSGRNMGNAITEILTSARGSKGWGDYVSLQIRAGNVAQLWQFKQ